MVRQLEFQAVVPGCTAKDFYQIACSDSQAITQFHLEANKDDTVTVTDWDPIKLSREVCFTLDIAIPSALKRFVGNEPIRVKEKQSHQWVDDNTLKITSVPILQISMAKSLSTASELYITTRSEGCQIDVTVTVSATVPWPLQSTVEALMADEAKKTVGEYVEFITKYVDRKLTEMNNLAAVQQQMQQQGAPLAVAEQAAELAAIAAEQQHQLMDIEYKQQAMQPGPIQLHATPAIAAPSRLHVAVPAAAEQDVFYDAQELPAGDYVTQALLRELQQAQQARVEANRLLVSIRDSVQQMEKTFLREAAFQEGVRYGQRIGAGSVLLSMTAAAAAASAMTAYVMLRRSK